MGFSGNQQSHRMCRDTQVVNRVPVTVGTGAQGAERARRAEELGDGGGGRMEGLNVNQDSWFCSTCCCHPCLLSLSAPQLPPPIHTKIHCDYMSPSREPGTRWARRLQLSA
mmetsp:Transcript_44919/g.70400  ORF Transcript_44919/g.70400 Transcript_44919/m.70400 type:complete len:111 (+) Transcript_44919:1049-1381(+)